MTTHSPDKVDAMMYAFVGQDEDVQVTKPKINTRRSIIECLIIATLITAPITYIDVAVSHHPLNQYEFWSVWTSFACTWLCTRQVRFNYVLGVISTALLVITFFQAHLYASMVLNIYLIPTTAYGWFIWRKDTDPKPVEHVKWRVATLYLLASLIVYLGALLAVHLFHGSLATLDSFLLVGSVLAQFLMDRKKIENWIIWAIVNVVSIYVYGHQGLYLLAAQFFFFLVNAIYAYYQWNKTVQV